MPGGTAGRAGADERCSAGPSAAGTTAAEKVLSEAVEASGRAEAVTGDELTQPEEGVAGDGCIVAVGGPTVGRGVVPLLWTAHPRAPSQNIRIQASTGMTCPDLWEIGFGRGRNFSPVDSPAPLLLV